MDVVLYNKITKMTEKIPVKNLCDPSEVVSGLMESNGTISTNSSYSTSGFIPIQNNTSYFFAAVSKTDTTKYANTRHRAALYDSSKNFISGTYIDQSLTHGLQIDVNNTSAKYLRVCVNDALGNRYFQVEEGTGFYGYDAYTTYDALGLKLGNTPLGQVNEVIVNSGIIQFEAGKNLVNPANLVTGFIENTGNISAEGSYANYKTSEFVPLEANSDYYFESYNASTGNIRTSQRVACLLFDEGKNIVANSYQNVANVGYLTFNSGNSAKYARVCTTQDSSFQLEESSSITSYEAFNGTNVIGYPLGKTPFAQTQKSNVLYKKKWAVCGDSFTDGATDTRITDDGIYKGYKYVYPYLIGNRNNMKIVKFFNGGQTLAFPAEPGTFTNSLTYSSGERYYQNIPADVDYITIYLGINDCNHASGSSQDGEDTTGLIPIGEITDNTTDTYYGAWNVVLTWLITNRPNAHIGIIVTNGNNANDNYRLAQIAIAQKYGIPYIDMNGDERTPAMIRTSNPNIASAVKNALIEKWRVSSDNSHPNDAAHLFESTFIENFLRSI